MWDQSGGLPVEASEVIWTPVAVSGWPVYDGPGYGPYVGYDKYPVYGKYVSYDKYPAYGTYPWFTYPWGGYWWDY